MTLQLFRAGVQTCTHFCTTSHDAQTLLVFILGIYKENRDDRTEWKGITTWRKGVGGGNEQSINATANNSKPHYLPGMFPAGALWIVSFDSGRQASLVPPC